MHNTQMIELLVSISFSIIFVLQIESFGYILSKILNILFQKFISKKNKLEFSPFLNIIIGLTFYPILLILIGSINLFNRNLLLIVTILPMIIAGIFYKRIIYLINYSKIKILENKLIFFGTILFYILSTYTTFRPITQFDAIWYHLPIPKLFLQNGNTGHLGDMLLYSVHPFSNFFWNSWFLSLPISTAFAGVAINWFQTGVFGLSLFYITQKLKENFKISKLSQLFIPILIGITPSFLFFYGAGYNDLYAILYVFVFLGYNFKKISTKKISWVDIYINGVIIAGLFNLKVIFGVVALIFATFFIFSYYNYFPTEKRIKKLLLIALSTFCILILPWIIRSYYYTGEILYPIGSDIFSYEAIYQNVGSNNPKIHWSTFIWGRFFEQFFTIFVNQISPILGLGLFSGVYYFKKHKDLFEIWVLGFFSFFFMYFYLIKPNIRYLFPQITIFLVLGFILFDRIIKNQKLIIKVFVFILLFSFTSLSYNYALARDGLENRIYLGSEHKLDDFIYFGSDKSHVEYSQSSSSPIPKDLDPKETILFLGSNRTAYINNPFIEHTINSDILQKSENAKDFVENLNKRGIRYLLTLNEITDNELCIIYKLDSDCGLIDYFELEVENNFNGFSWYKIK